MKVQFRFKSARLAEDAATKLPIACEWRIVRDRTSDAYLEIPEDYEDYFERYLYTSYRQQEA